MQDVDELGQLQVLVDSWSSTQQTVFDQEIDQWRFRLGAWATARCRQFEPAFYETLLKYFLSEIDAFDVMLLQFYRGICVSIIVLT